MNRRIAFFIPTLAQGGGERVVSEVSLHLPDSMERVIILFEERVSYPYKGKIVSLGTPVSTNFFLRAWYFFVRVLRFRRALKSERPDLVISLGNSANIINILTNRRAVIRVDMFLSVASKGFSGQLFKIAARLLFPRAERVISVSRSAAKDLTEHFGVPERKIQVLYNPVDIAKIERMAQDSVPEEYAGIFAHPVVISMGRLTEQKGQWDLIRAFRDIKNSISDVHLVILGEGEFRDMLQKLACDLGLEESVHFLGWQRNPFSFLSRATLFALPSLWEGLPDVLLEAMACRLPIISTDCKSGPREILAPSTDIEFVTKGIEMAEYGILVPIGRPDLFGKAILQMMENPQLRSEFAEKGNERARDFAIESILREWKFLQSA